MALPYITDVPYPSRFYPFLSPGVLAYVCALNGFPSPRPAGGGFRYCELGCGGGVSLVTLAAANPEAEFTGIDLNPAHVESARDLARRGEVGNVRLVAASFADLDPQAYPPFDFIVLHGVYAWVPADVRRDIVRFLDARLAPGGIALVSYNALPGSLVLQPLRDAMLLHTEGMAGDSVARMRAGLAFLRALRDGGAEYFVRHPELLSDLDRIGGQDLEYLAHEFLNPAWSPMYFADVAADLARAGLVFAGGLPLATNYLDLSIPPEHQELFRRAPTRLAAESNKALVTNERFRRDVFVRAAGPALPEAERHTLFADSRFGCRVAVPAREVTVRLGPRVSRLAYDGPLYDAIVPALAARAHSLAELVALPNLAGRSPAEVLDAVHMLVIGDEVRPFARPSLPPGRLDDAGAGPALAGTLNRVLLEQALAAGESVFLASSVAGDGIGIAAVDVFLLAALGEAGAKDALAWTEARLAASGQSLERAGQSLGDAAERAEALGERLAEVVETVVPKLVELGILVAPAI